MGLFLQLRSSEADTPNGRRDAPSAPHTSEWENALIMLDKVGLFSRFATIDGGIPGPSRSAQHHRSRCSQWVCFCTFAFVAIISSQTTIGAPLWDAISASIAQKRFAGSSNEAGVRAAVNRDVRAVDEGRAR
jgi:hypothetical protein